MGHAALIAGSPGMLGAAILAARACLRSGVGKLTCFCSEQAYPILQPAMPEAVFRIGELADSLSQTDMSAFQSIGTGPGIGISDRHIPWMAKIMALGKPMVLDADALTLMARHRHLMNAIPADSILTPHRKEFERLFGSHASPVEAAGRYRCIIIMKGPNSRVVGPDGKTSVNRSGNPGMATAGAGDVLTGMLTGLLARGYPPYDAARVGVFLHGLAGDAAARETGMESLLAGDIVDHIGKAYLQVEAKME